MQQLPAMDEKDFKKHLQELVHGHHHPEEHDWPDRGPIETVEGDRPKKPKAKPSKAKKK